MTNDIYPADRIVKKLIIFGTGNFAQMAHYFFDRDSEYQTAAFTVDAEFLEQPSYQGLPIVPYEEVEKRYPPEEFEMFAALGLREVNLMRMKKIEDALAGQRQS